MQPDTTSPTDTSVDTSVDTAGILGPLDFDALERQIRDLEVKIDGELAFHQEMLRQVTLDSGSIQEILRSTAVDDELAADIDRVIKSR